MAIKETEIDPLTGIKTKLTYRDDGKVDVVQTQDLTQAVEYAKLRRAQEKPTFDSPGRKEKWNHYAIIPAVVQHEMYQQGIDVARDGKAVFEFINKNYPALKLTNRWHDDKRARIRDTRIIVK